MSTVLLGANCRWWMTTRWVGLATIQATVDMLHVMPHQEHSLRVLDQVYLLSRYHDDWLSLRWVTWWVTVVKKHVTWCFVFGQLHLSKMCMCPLLAYLSQCVKFGDESTRKGYCKDKQAVMAYIKIYLYILIYIIYIMFIVSFWFLLYKDTFVIL